MNWTHPFSAAIGAGFIALDITGIGPFMLSQPLVCGPIFGALLGDVQAGLLVGGIVQLLWLDVTPVGVGVPRDVTAITLLGVYWAQGLTGDLGVRVGVALAMAVPFGLLFQWFDQRARRLNTWVVRRVDHVPEERLSRALAIGIGAGVLGLWGRYSLAYAVAFWAGMPISQWAMGELQRHVWMVQSVHLGVTLLPMAGLGVALDVFLTEETERKIPSWRPSWFCAGKSETK